MTKLKLIAMTILLLAALSVLHAAEPDPSAEYGLRLKPVMFLRLGETPASEKDCFKDATGNALGGTASADKELPKQADGGADWMGKGLEFVNGGASVFVPSTPATAKLGDTSATTGLSVSFWIKKQRALNDGSGRVLNFQDVLEIVNDKMAAAFLGFNVCGAPIVNYKANSVKVMDGAWHQIGVTADFKKENDNLSLYIDGRLANTSTVVFKSTKQGKNSGLVIGGRRSGSADLTGAIDEVALFDRPLSDEEMAVLHDGPVSAGVPQTLILPEKGTLRGSMPPGASAQWSQKSGPTDAVIADSKKLSTGVEFSKPGKYVFALRAAGRESEVAIEVKAATPPVVSAGNGQVAKGDRRVELQGSVTQAGVSDSNLFKLKWSKIEGPGDVRFDAPDKLRTAASFTADGLYQLRLTAVNGELSGQGDVSVLCGSKAQPQSANMLFKPQISLPFNEPAEYQPDAIADETGHTAFVLNSPERGLPKLIPGARPFTGYAWDFAGVDATVAALNRFTVAHLGNIEKSTGLSYAFWMKANNEPRARRLFMANDAAVSASGNGKGGDLLFEIGTAKLGTGKENCFTGQWRHVAVTVDFRSAKENCRVYVDGAPVETQTVVFDKSFDTIRTEKQLVIGVRTSGMGGERYGGAFDDFGVYDRALTEQEVKTLLNGPDAAQSALLARTDRPKIEAGPNQFLPLPQNSTDLKASIPASGYKVRWSKVSGPGEVTFSAPDALSTKVSFDHKSTAPSGLYGTYVLRVTAKDDAGMEASDDVTVTLFEDNKPAVRKMSAVPPAGVHPRILFSPEDVPNLRERVKRIPYAKMAMDRIRAEGGKLSDPKTIEGGIYQKLLANEASPILEQSLKKTSTEGSFYRPYFSAAITALVDDDRETGVKLGRAIAAAARRQLASYSPLYTWNLVPDADQYLGLAYDFLAPWMDEADRKPVRQLLSRMTKWRQSMGTGETPQENSTNWRGYHDHIVIASLAIEGEEGYDPEVFQANVRRLRDFLTQYGVHASGSSHEATVYFNFGMEWAGPALIATARRDENFFRTARVYDVAMFAFRQMSPWGDALYSHDDGGWRGDMPMIVYTFIAPWMYPDSKPVQAAARALTENAMANTREQRTLTFWAALFGTDLDPKITPAEAARQEKLPLTLFCPDSGFMLARSAWADNALRLDFRCKSDTYELGHVHTDRNSFELFGAGRDWIVDAGKARWHNDDHSTILVDGIGGSLSIKKSMGYHNLPGKFVDFVETPEASIGCADAKVFYSYEVVPCGDNTPITDHGLTWADFVYKTPRETAIKNEPWRSSSLGTLYSYNPMLRAFRTAALVRGAHPYVLIVDDYAKDDKVHEWDWLANVPVQELVREDSTGSTLAATDLLLRGKKDEAAGPRLLVRALNANGQVGNVELEDRTYKDHALHSVISIKAKSVAPDYRTLLFPHIKGDALPVTTWNSDKTKLTVEWKDQKDEFDLKPGPDGRTRVTLRRDGKVAAELK